jgi:hypothetical protein
MSFVRNISGGELDVPLLGRSVGDGETVEVPDFQPAHSEENPLPIVWPPDKWQPVAGPEWVGEPGPELVGFPVGAPEDNAAADGTSTEGM